MLDLSGIVSDSIVDGPGIRTTFFCQGCPHHCPGCHNPETWDFDYGHPYTLETEDRILRLLMPEYIEGLTLLGGEPFEPENQPAILELLRRIKAEMPEKSIWAFSGYLFDKITSGTLGDWEITKEYLGYLDVLVDGPFVEEKKNLSLRFRGSENQRLIDVPASLASGEVVLWQDWQGEKKGMKT